MNDLILAKLKEIVQLLNIIKEDDVNFESKRGKTLVNYSKEKILVNIHNLFLRDTHKGHLSIEKN